MIKSHDRMRHHRLRLRGIALLVAASTFAAACSGGESSSDTTIADESSESTTSLPFDPDAAPAEGPIPDGFVARGSLLQISVEGDPGATATVFSGGAVVDAKELDEFGGAIWRGVDPGDYVVSVESGDLAGSETVTVYDESLVPDPSLYSGQTLEAGYTYLTVRDGTKLGTIVTPPAGKTLADGPFPTLVEYSGYDLSNPFEQTAGSSPYRLLAPLLGFALVQVQMRGSGCSGGAFDYFERLQSFDGYDAVETVAAQPWVLDNEVGMVGISYPGISQLFVAATQPPSLAAITPVSVIADTARSTLYPGAIFNNGFALNWARGRMRDALPSPDGQSWVPRKIAGDADAGFDPDPICEANQRLHGQAVDLEDRIGKSQFETGEYSYLSPERFVDQIKAPTLMIGAWQDEQTGGHWAYLLDSFPDDTYLRAIGQNGTHIEPFAPENLFAILEFLDLFVKKQTPQLEIGLRVLAGELYAQLLGSAPPEGASLALPDDRFSGSSYEDALAAYLAEDPIIIRFDNGAGPTGAQAGFFGASESRSFSTWPVPEAAPWELYFTDDGSLSTEAVDGADAVSYSYDPAWGARTSWTGGDGCNEWLPDPKASDGSSCFDWQEQPAANRASFVTPTLTEDVIAVGHGIVDLWLASDATDTDIEVALTEIRPDGQEIYVQSGWMRASRRALDPSMSQPYIPWASLTEADVQPLVAGEMTQMEIGIFPFAHIFRAGSKVRLTVSSPGGNRVLWKFDSQPTPSVNTVGTAAANPSKLVLPVLTGASATTPLPPCVLRAQPCRPAAG
jgi:uncharacterized protein